MSYVVVGANYGDEGKGLMTDYFVRKANARVVSRFNGGAQAGHTVTTDDCRHVFGHVGAGTFAGAETYLSSDFIVNPYLFAKELVNLSNFCDSPRILIHPKACVSTIYDMAINTILEASRGRDRHGSCGIGINETVTRNKFALDEGMPELSLTFSDVKAGSFSKIKSAMKNIHQVWVPLRLKQLGLENISEFFHEKTANILRDKSYISHAENILNSLRHAELFNNEEIDFQAVVFEGAQGLALDEELGQFPHVTRSLTGLPQAIKSAVELNVSNLEPVYVSRAYTTRHGAGPLSNDGVFFTPQYLEDKTNVHNQWQGSLRYAPLNLSQLKSLIEADLKRSLPIADECGVRIDTPVIALTCLDQVESTPLTVIDVNGKKINTKVKDLSNLVSSQVGITVRYTSFGPKAKDVVQIS